VPDPRCLPRRLPLGAERRGEENHTSADEPPSTDHQGLSAWQREPEGRALSYLTLHPDPAAVEFDELPGERQPEPGAFGFLVCGAYLPKLLEHRGLIRRRDADARVRDGHFCDTIVQPGADVDPPPFGRELQGVGQEV